MDLPSPTDIEELGGLAVVLFGIASAFFFSLTVHVNRLRGPHFWRWTSALAALFVAFLIAGYFAYAAKRRHDEAAIHFATETLEGDWGGLDPLSSTEPFNCGSPLRIRVRDQIIWEQTGAAAQRYDLVAFDRGPIFAVSSDNTIQIAYLRSGDRLTRIFTRRGAYDSQTEWRKCS